MNKTLAIAILMTGAIFGQAPTTTPAVPQQAETQLEVTASSIVETYQVGDVATVQFRARLANGQTTSDFRGLPVVFATTNREANVTSETTKCQLEIGVCTVRSTKPQVLFITALLRGVFGISQVTLNFVNMRSNLPATMDISASAVQAQVGSSTTLVATSPISISGPAFLEVTTLFTNTADSYSNEVYLPKGVVYGQRIEINTETATPFLFRNNRYFRVTLHGPNGTVVAQGFGTSVGTSMGRNFDAVLDDNGDLMFTIGAVYDPSVDYTVVLLRGNNFRVELAQSRNEIYAYPAGRKTVIVFNRGSLRENTYMLPFGMYTVNIHALDKSNSIPWNMSSADALAINGQFFLN